MENEEEAEVNDADIGRIDWQRGKKIKINGKWKMGFDIGYKEEINDNRVSVQRGDKKEKKWI